MIIKTSSTSSSILQSNVLIEVKTNSKIACAQACRENGLCAGSVLLGNSACVLYSNTYKTCSCPDGAESISPELDSRYKIHKVGLEDSFADVRAVCHREGMKLLDINSQYEQDKIQEFFTDYSK